MSRRQHMPCLLYTDHVDTHTSHRSRSCHSNRCGRSFLSEAHRCRLLSLRWVRLAGEAQIHHSIYRRVSDGLGSLRTRRRQDRQTLAILAPAGRQRASTHNIWSRPPGELSVEPEYLSSTLRLNAGRQALKMSTNFDFCGPRVVCRDAEDQSDHDR